MNRAQAVSELRQKKFNCCQSTFAAFAEDLGLDLETALKLSTCFGGGMRCGEVCGAVTGALMALGLKYGSAKENDDESKMPAYKKTVEFLDKFKARNGCIRCMDLLGHDTSNPEVMKIVKEKGLGETVCKKAILDAVEILEEIL